MSDDHYPPGTVRALLGTDLVTSPTASALRHRLPPTAPPTDSVLDADICELLTAVAARLIPQPERAVPIDLGALLLQRLSRGSGIGWRYAELPADPVLLTQGLGAIDQTAWAQRGGGFCTLDASTQDAILGPVQSGAATGTAWQGLSSPRFFEILLCALVDIYYAHPLAQEEIGYAGMADAHGWPDVGLGARAAHEPVAGSAA